MGSSNSGSDDDNGDGIPLKKSGKRGEERSMEISYINKMSELNDVQAYPKTR